MNADAPASPPAATAEPPATPAVTADTPPLPAPEAAPPPAPPLVWPEWFRAMDIALAIFAVVLAFLLGSFVARNADLWRHLAAGRLVAQFQYPFGGDPFSYTAADRPWVNPNWLGEVVLYALHAADGSGAAAVGAKAVAFAAAIGLLFLLRKPNAPLWPWAVAAAVGAVAAGGFTHLRPQVFGLPLMAGFLAVLYTADWAKWSKWRVPGILGGITAVWANTDGFALLAPLLVGLTLLGEWLHPKVFPKGADLPGEEDPFRQFPPRDALLRTLLLCGVAVLVNPTFVGGLFKNPGEAVAQLVPFELDWQAADDLKTDKDLRRYTQSALNPEYMSSPVLGNNPAGWFALGLWAAGAVAAGLGYRHGRLSHLLVWAAFTLLAAAVHARFVPYAVLVGVPFLAAHLNGFGRWVPPLDKLNEQAGRGVLLGCRFGRIVCLTGVVLLVLSAVPGWLHPWNATDAGRRYVSWGVRPDEGMKRAGEVFARWHADDARRAVLTELHGLNTHPDLGDYLAYFAPPEKSFVTSRYRLHRPELKDLVEVRQKALAEWPKDLELPPPVEVGWMAPLVEKYGVGHVSVAQTEARTELNALLNVRMGFGVRLDEMIRYGPPWHLDGRLLVVGRTRSLTDDEQRRYDARGSLPPEEAAEAVRMEEEVRGRARNKAMSWDVAREVFGPQPPPQKPEGMKVGRPPEQGWEYELLAVIGERDRPPPRPLGLDDAEAYSGYAEQLLNRRGALDQRQYANWQRQANAQWANWTQMMGAAGGLQGWWLTQPVAGPQRSYGRIPQSPPPPPVPPGDPEYALPFLVARSARGGLALDPNLGAGYMNLGAAFSTPMMPVTELPADLFPVSARRMPPNGPSEGELQMITALVRATSRLPEPGPTPVEHLPTSLRARMTLLRMYLQVGPSQQVVAFRKVGGQIGQEVGPLTKLGYVDLAKGIALDLVKVAEAAPPEYLQEIAGELVPLWQRVLEMCMADFWFDFQGVLARGQVPEDWWRKIDANDMLGLLIDRGYLKADDWGKWEKEFAQAAAAGKADRGTFVAKLARLRDLLDDLRVKRIGRIPPADIRPAEAFLGAVVSGLPGMAAGMLLNAKEEARAAMNVTLADELRLLLWVGYAEDVQQRLDADLATTTAAGYPADKLGVEQAKFRMLKYDLARLNGDYAQAEAVYAELLAAKLDALTPQPVTLLLYSDLWRPQVYKPLSEGELKGFVDSMSLLTGGMVVAGGLGVVQAEPQLNLLRSRLLFEAATRYQRGVYALLGGDPARAKEQFEKAADPQGFSRFLPPPTPEEAGKLPIQRIGLPDSVNGTFNQALPKYLELLQKYEK